MGLLAVTALGLLILAFLSRAQVSDLIWRMRGLGILPGAKDEPVDLPSYRQKSAQYASMKSTEKIVFFGDSRIEWADWPALLKRDDVSNRGVAGDTMSGLVERMRTSVPTDEVVCIIQAGVNDVLKGASSDVVVGGYRQLAQYLLKERKARVIVTSIIPVAESQAVLNATIGRCNRQLSQLAAETGMEWLNLNAALAPHGFLLSEYSEDGVHLNANGYAQFCRALEPILPNE